MQIFTHYKESPNEVERFYEAFSAALKSYEMPENVTEELPSSSYGENSVKLNESVVSHFPVRMYKGFKDLFDTTMNPTNYASTRVIIWTKDNLEFTRPEPVYVYTDSIQPNYVGDSYVRLLTTLHFPSSTGYHRFDYPLYKPLEKSYIESISIRIVTKSGGDVVFDDSVIPCLVVLHFKRRSLMK
jgi:hypothetical protein